jgi:hypothetical protein
MFLLEPAVALGYLFPIGAECAMEFNIATSRAKFMRAPCRTPSECMVRMESRVMHESEDGILAFLFSAKSGGQTQIEAKLRMEDGGWKKDVAWSKCVRESGVNGRARYRATIGVSQLGVWRITVWHRATERSQWRNDIVYLNAATAATAGRFASAAKGEVPCSRAGDCTTTTRDARSWCSSGRVGTAPTAGRRAATAERGGGAR